MTVLVRRSLAAVLAIVSNLACAQVNTQARAGKKPPTLLVISLDGMKPEYVTHADEHGLKIPHLRSFLTQGTYAEGVTGMLPTVTYPSHTALVTGVWPIESGVTNNTVFDPLGQHPDTWYWDFKDIKVATLYTEADKAGLTTAAVSWPVTVGAPIDYLIAEGMQSEHTDMPSGNPYNPSDIFPQLGIDHKTRGVFPDAEKTQAAIGILRKFHPNFMLVHLAALDHEEHGHGPFSAEANAAMEVLDKEVGEMEEALLQADPGARIAVVSDHGFLPVDHHVNLGVLLAQAGLIELGPVPAGKKQPSVVSWKAACWPAGGTVAIVLHDPNDKDTAGKVKAILDKAAADPANGIAQVLAQPEISKRGGFPQAAFLVDFKPLYQQGSALAGPVVTDALHTGTHGYLTTHPEMRSAFMVKGPGIAKARDLQVIDMRQIAPSFAEMLGIRLSAAKLPPVHYRP